MVVYSGHDTKIMKNSQHATIKNSEMEHMLNKLILATFMIQLVSCLFFGYFADQWAIEASDVHKYLAFDFKVVDKDEEQFKIKILVDTLTNCGRWMIVMSNLVPISLIVTVESVRFIQGLFMQWDIDLIDRKTGIQAGVQASNLNEQLGNVSYIFSDKTGTLTKNYMEFKKVSIGNYSYGFDSGLAGHETDPDLERADEEAQLVDNDSVSSRNACQSSAIPNFNFYDPEFDMHLREPSHPNHKNIVNFLLHLALCHTIVIQKKKSRKSRILENAADSDTS